MAIAAAAFVAGRALNRSAETVDRGAQPAGFGSGVRHGTLMPCALPALALGRDVAIYAQQNTGLNYKLGYTVGVNGCGAVFFGTVYWRLRRWRKFAAQGKKLRGQ